METSMDSRTIEASRPSHIPDAAVYDFDLFQDPELLTDPHERIRRLVRDAPPVFWTPRNGGHWVAAGYDAAFRVARDHEDFSNAPMSPEAMARRTVQTPSGSRRVPRPVPIMLDPPEHTKFRLPLNRVFSPKAMMARIDDIRGLTDSLIDAVIDKGHCEFIADIGEPLPVQVFLKIMGLPLERMRPFRDLVHQVLGYSDDRGAIMCKIVDSMRDVMEARRTNPQDDLISLLWSTEIDGKPMDWEMMEDFGVLLFVGGLDTVINGMGYGVRHLARNPTLQKQLRDDPALIPEALEEILRRYTFTVPPRWAARETELEGWTLKAGERVMLLLPAADLDAGQFPSPETFDLERKNKAHIAFGAGPHRCVGSHLARVELQVLYEQILTRLPEFRLDETAPAKFRAGNVLAIQSLPIRWD
jgi:cytochrome P450